MTLLYQTFQVTSDQAINDKSNICAQKYRQLSSAKSVMAHKGDKQDRKRDHDHELELHFGAADSDRTQQRRHTQNQQQIGNVSTDNIADREVGFLVICGGQRCRQFRQRRAKRDQSDGDNQLADANIAGDIDSAFHHQARSYHQCDDANQKKNKFLRPARPRWRLPIVEIRQQPVARILLLLR